MRTAGPCDRFPRRDAAWQGAGESMPEELRSAPLVLDGKALARALEAELALRVEKLKAATGRTPILATILVGDDPASATYVRMKGNACRRVGMESRRIALPAETTSAGLLAAIDALNADADVHGILLQHPVPRGIDERACFDRIALEKDVDREVLEATDRALAAAGTRARRSGLPRWPTAGRPGSP